MEVDKTYIGGGEPGLSGDRVASKKVLTGIAVEVREPKGIGQCGIAPLVDASSLSLHRFVVVNVEPGTRVIADGWKGYSGLEELGCVYGRRSQRTARARGEDLSKLFPAEHRVAAPAKRWLLGIHQGALAEQHLAA